MEAALHTSVLRIEEITPSVRLYLIKQIAQLQEKLGDLLYKSQDQTDGSYSIRV